MCDVEELTVKQCWELLRSAEMGRLAVIVEDHPWQAGTKERYIRIVPHEVTGRCFLKLE